MNESLVDTTSPATGSTQIELVSVHIPKTAGTSFERSLREAYGAEHVVRIDISRAAGKTKILLDQGRIEGTALPASTKVIHGHFSPILLKEHFAIPDNTPFITWVRDPVERVASSYYYLQEKLANALDQNQVGLDVLDRMQRSLTEFAQDPRHRNRMWKTLGGASVEAFDYVGRVDNYEADLQAMSTRFGWEGVEIHRDNTAKRSYTISDEERLFISELNTDDIALYSGICMSSSLL